MPATNQDVTVYQSDSFDILIPVKDEDGSPVEVTSARWCLAEATPTGEMRQGGDVYVSKEMGSGISVESDGSLYTVRVRLLPGDTRNLAPGTHYHELEATDSAGNTSTATTGRFYLKPTAIRP